MKFKFLSVFICFMLFLPGNVYAYDTDQINEEASVDLTTTDINESSIEDDETIIEDDSKQDVTESTNDLATPKMNESSVETETSNQEEPVPSSDLNIPEKKEPSMEYAAHIQTTGWQKAVKEGETAGTIGKYKRMEAYKVNLDTQGIEGSIEYRSYVQNSGWEKNWKKNNEISGTTGKSLRIEAFQMKLTGEIANQYDLYYRAHMQHYGWLGWAKNGEKAGTSGMDYRVEGMEVILVRKGESAPESTKEPFKQSLVNYQAHTQTYGWQKGTYFDGAIAGTVSQSKRMEAVRIKLNDQLYSGNIEYRTHVQKTGWEKTWKSNGAISGTTGKYLRIEAIQIRLTGEMAEHYDVYYRTHVQHFGWLGWTKNGEMAGTTSFGYRMEAVQIQLVPKGGKAPGSTNHSYYKYSSWVSNLKASKSTSQLIVVSVTSGNYANVSMHNKLSDGTWSEKFNVGGRIGKNGLNKTKEGDGKTPVGIYSLTQAFGVAGNPGCTRSYLKLNNNHYWVDDSSSSYYNKLVDKSKTGIQWKSAEQLIKYPEAYEYAIALDFNSNCIPGKGSAIFLHCSTSGPTAGCISIPRAQMQYVLQNLKSDTKIIIDYQSNISNY